jgi:MoaA/NifB/PqqE/SkfB family radical SAM enzyme
MSMIEEARQTLAQHISLPETVWMYKIKDAKKNLEFPKNLFIEPTNDCNHVCTGCPRDKSDREVGFMEWDMFTRLIDECREHRKRMLFQLHKDGEPLMYPRIGEMLQYIKKARPGFKIFLSTNGALLREETARMIIETGIDILRVSHSGDNPSTYFKIHGRPDFEVVRENVVRLLEMKKKMNAKKPHVRMQIIRTQVTEGDIESYQKTWGQYDVEVAVKAFMTWGGSKRDALTEWKKDGRHPCIDLWAMPAVNWDGKVSICSLDWNQKAIIGDLTQQSMSEVWQGEKLAQYRDHHLQNKYAKAGICGACTEWQSNRQIFWRNRTPFQKEQRWV